MSLIIVESPTKAKTLSKFLGNKFTVMASMGHIRDLPRNKLNIDVEHDFEPDYQVMEDKAKIVKQLISQAKKTDEIYLATDPDREGEAIAYHVEFLLKQAIKAKKKYKRISFHQITKAAVEEAIAHSGQVNDQLVDAQQARRVLDRLVGYSLSPVLWRKVRRGLSAGRVQSVALKLLVEREKEIEKFQAKEFWEIKVEVANRQKNKFWLSLDKISENEVVTGKGDNRNFVVNNQEKASQISSDLKGAFYQVESVNKSERKKYPFPPFSTSTLQQAAANRYGWSGKKTMRTAQGLYEKGFITYHRTDSLHLAPEAIQMVRNHILDKYGQDYLPSQPIFYKTKSKSAQEAHEAIRPTSDQANPGDMDTLETKLYELIFKRFVACQMVPAVYDAMTILVKAKGEKDYSLKATGSVVKFSGFRIVYGRMKSEEDEVILPEVADGEELKYINIDSQQKFTEPPSRYNDASLVKTLESLGIGRPSTYAPTISTLIVRGYVERKDRRFYPTSVGVAVVKFLAKNFREIMDYDFTANMENDLDKIADGKRDWVPVVREFWKPFNTLVKSVTKDAKRVEIPAEKTGETCPLCGESDKGEVVIRIGRFGKFLSCSRFPECKYTGRYQEKLEMKCPECKNGDVVVKRTKTGRTFYGCSSYPSCSWASWSDPRKPSTIRIGGKKSSKRKKVK